MLQFCKVRVRVGVRDRVRVGVGVGVGVGVRVGVRVGVIVTGEVYGRSVRIMDVSWVAWTRWLRGCVVTSNPSSLRARAN